MVLEDAENRCGLGSIDSILDQFAEQFCLPAKPYEQTNFRMQISRRT